jgi:methionine synthase I (cobalamin-dependent)/5,10-methylenetetrahydrofolate reductase
LDTKEKLLDLREKLNERVLVGDGALGTLLADRGVDQPYSRANLTHASAVRAVHEEYLRAGARVIETNTFLANRLKLAAHSLKENVYNINAQGAWLAREAPDALPRGEDAFVLGSVGPLGRPLAPIGPILPDEAKDVFMEQAKALLKGGADALLLETFTDLAELKLAHEAVSALGVPMLAYKTFIEDGETLAAGLPSQVAREISCWGSEGSRPIVVGTNCTVGPQRMLEIIEQMAAESGPVAAYPNPALPQFIHGVIRYNQEVNHFAKYGVKLARAGAHLIGGCCGTTPVHIKALTEALRDFKRDTSGVQRSSVATMKRVEKVAVEPRSTLAEKIRTGLAITVEVDLPRGHDISGVVEAAKTLKERGVYAIDISDGAMARLRMHPFAVAKIIEEIAGIEVVAHLSCRDRNIIGLQPGLLSAAALRVKNILAITGDPPQIGDYPEATGVFDTSAVGLIHILNKFNHGEDLAGNPIGEPPGFLIGAAFNPTAENLDAEVDKLRQKLEVGAHAFWTQPVFEIEALENALEKIEGINVELLLGLMPLRSACQAEFLHHEVPGINIPKYVRKKLAELNKEDAPKYGVEVAQNLLIEAKPLVSGAYLMPPASMPHLAGDVIEPII